MGMFSEVGSSIIAKKLEGILQKALDTNDFKTIKFVKENILPLYVDEKGEAFESPNKFILDYFNKIGSI